MTPASLADSVTDQTLRDAVDVALEWRASFQRPLNTVTQGLRQFVRRELQVDAGTRLPVGQRLKRLPTIIDKLARMPTWNLTQLQDIGGCRAILADEAQTRAVLARITRNWQIKGQRDYIVEPKVTGYRAVHVVVINQGRLIEVQLRTESQHEWAVAVERASARLREGVKFGVGPPDLIRFFKMAAEGIALTETGQEVDEGFWRDFQNLRERVGQYFPHPLGPPGVGSS